jgi:uncharacterized delta-60 repeat protein
MRVRVTAAVSAALAASSLIVALSSAGAAGAGAPGSLDPTFGNGGIATSHVGGFPTDSLQEPNGDFLVSLDFGASSGVARFLPNGALDTSFGVGGVARATPSEVAGSPIIEVGAGSLALEASGKIVVAGNARAADGATAFGVARFDANGTLDTTFGGDGVVQATSPLEGSISDNAVLVQPNGQILVGGYRLVGGRPERFFGLIMRFKANGTLDAGFGNAGQVNLTANQDQVVEALGLDASGDIFVLDGATAAQTELSAGGAIDASVTPATITSSSKGGYGVFGGPRVFLSNDQSLVAHAVTTSRRGYKSQVQRFGPTGVLDSTFANPLFRYNGETGVLGKDAVSEVLAGANGKIVAVGNHHPEGTSAGVGSFGVERINANGELDATFGNGGGVTTSLLEVDNFYTAVVEPDGDIVAAGLASKGETSEVVLVRYQG